MHMSTSFIQEIESLSNPRDESQLRRLDEALASTYPLDCGEKEFRSLLQVFERFPEDDGFEVFWGIVHFLEACNGYEPFLIESVNRMPVEFNVVMINRLLNAGVAKIGDSPLMDVLESVLLHSSATQDAKQCAQRFIDYQRKK